MKVDLDKEWDQSQGFLGLAQLLNFNWVTAVGDRPVSADEFELIKAQAGSVVRFHDSFMFVSPEAIRKIQSNLADGGKKFNQLSMLRAALSGEIDDAPVTLSKSVKEALARLLQESPVTVPKTIHAKLRPYQERGFSWLTRNNKIGLGSILADDMGLGKTLQVICMLEQLRLDSCLKKKPALIVVPTSLIANWQREVQKFSPKFKLALYYGAQRNFPAQDADAVLTTYGTMRNSADMLKKKSFSVLVFDEAQNLKNHTTSTFRVAKSIKHDTTVAMSGTPVENRLAEYWSIMELTNPGLLGTITQFKKDYAAPIEVMHNIKVADQFKRLTAPFIMRRLKTDKSVISDLPEKISTDEYCSLTAEQAALYEETVSKYLKIIEANEGFERRSIVLQLIIRLKQICNSPMQYEANSPYSNPENSGKTLRLFELLDELFESGRKVLIFTQFKSMGSLLQQWLKARYQKEPNFIYGGLSQKKRQEMVDSFQTDRSQNALILSLKAAGTGLNLTAASAIIHYDLWWNPAVEAQATDRAYRIGQKKNVNVYRMICANTFEERINEMIEAKKSLAALTVESGENWIGDLGNDELRELFKLH